MKHDFDMRCVSDPWTYHTQLQYINKGKIYLLLVLLESSQRSAGFFGSYEV